MGSSAPALAASRPLKCSGSGMPARPAARPFAPAGRTAKPVPSQRAATAQRLSRALQNVTSYETSIRGGAYMLAAADVQHAAQHDLAISDQPVQALQCVILRIFRQVHLAEYSISDACTQS